MSESAWVADTTPATTEPSNLYALPDELHAALARELQESVADEAATAHDSDDHDGCDTAYWWQNRPQISPKKVTLQAVNSTRPTWEMGRWMRWTDLFQPRRELRR